MAEDKAEGPSRRLRGRLETDAHCSDDDDADPMALADEPDRNASPSRQRSPGKDFLCVVPGCESSFTRKYSLKLHLQRAHPDYKGPLTESSKNDRNKSVKKWMCPKAGCPSGYSRKSDLKVHLEKVHPDLAATYQIFDFRGKTLRDEVGDPNRRDVSPTTLNFSNFRLDSGSSTSSRASSPTRASREASPAPGRASVTPTPSRLNNFNIRDISPHPTRTDSSHVSPIKVPPHFPNPNSHPNPNVMSPMSPMMGLASPFGQTLNPSQNWTELNHSGGFDFGANMGPMNISIPDPNSNPNWGGPFPPMMVRDTSPNPMQRGMHFNHSPKSDGDKTSVFGNTNNSSVGFGGSPSGIPQSGSGHFGPTNLGNSGGFGTPNLGGNPHGFGGNSIGVGDGTNLGFSRSSGDMGSGQNAHVGVGFETPSGLANMGPMGNMPNHIGGNMGSFSGEFPNENPFLMNISPHVGHVGEFHRNAMFPQPGFNPQVGPGPMLFGPAPGSATLPPLGTIIDSTRNVSPLRFPPSPGSFGSPTSHNFGTMTDTTRSELTGSSSNTSPFLDPSFIRNSSPLRFPSVGSDGFSSESDRTLTPTSRVRILRDVTPPRGRPSDLTPPPSSRLRTSSGSAFSPIFGLDSDSSIQRLRPTLHIFNAETPTTTPPLKEDAVQRTPDSLSLLQRGADPMVVEETSATS